VFQFVRSEISVWHDGFVDEPPSVAQGVARRRCSAMPGVQEENQHDGSIFGSSDERRDAIID